MIYKISDCTTLLIIDAQNEYFDFDGNLYTQNAKECKDNLFRLQRKCKQKSVDIIYISNMNTSRTGASFVGTNLHEVLQRKVLIRIND